MRWVVCGHAVIDHAASTSQMGRFETGAMTEEKNLTALADLSGCWIDRVQTRRGSTALVLDIDSSVSPTYGAQEGTAYNGHVWSAPDPQAYCRAMGGHSSARMYPASLWSSMSSGP